MSRTVSPSPPTTDPHLRSSAGGGPQSTSQSQSDSAPPAVPRRPSSAMNNNGNSNPNGDQQQQQQQHQFPPHHRPSYLPPQLQYQQLQNQSPLPSPAGAGAMHPPPGYYRTFSQPDFRPPDAVVTPEASSSTSHTAGPSPNAGGTPPATSSAAPPQPKRKRKEGKGKAASVAAPSSAMDQSEEDEAERAKRTKTQRACDPCRRKKIRCDIIPDSEPAICQHCRQYSYECTFYLPITETRFKKKRMEEAAAAAAAAAASGEIKVETSNGVSGAPPPRPRASTSLSGADSGPEPKEVKIYGPTSLSFILHSTPSIPVRAFENYDARYHETWEVGKSGDGFIQVSDHSPPLGSANLAKHPIEYNRLDREVLASLINAYFHEIAPQFPIVSEAEFLSTSSPPPVLLYAICSVAAARRGIPKEVFDSLRMAVNQIIKAEDVLSTASVVNVQALLILGMSGDVHSTSIQNAMTAAWLRLGAAIRMAQDLGLYRAEAVKKNVELRRRLWGACVIADRWYGACFGHPFMVDVLDCDVRLPAPDDPADPTVAETKPNCYLAELIKLSILLGKVTKTIYSPSGLVHATDEMITRLLAELDHWRENLHPDLVYKGSDSILPAGLLHLFYTCVCMMFWRVFLRLSYRCPAHLKFSLTVERWTELVKWSKESIEWLDKHEKCFDSWMFVAYAASSCALIQYHTWARRRDPEAAANLKILRDCVLRWESSLQPGHMNARRKTAEIIILLYEVTQLPRSSLNLNSDGQRLNPTVGVSDRPPGTENWKKLKFTKDPSRPGGGVYIADEKAVAEAVSDVALGTVVLIETEDKDGNPTHKVDDSNVGQQHIGQGSEDVASLLLNIAPLQPGSARFGMASAPTFAGPGFSGGGPAGSLLDFPGGLDITGASGSKPPRGPVSNVNPSMNYNYAPVMSGGVNGWTQQLAGGGGVQVLNLLDQPLDGNVNAYQMLQGIPFDTFNAAGWEEYFARLTGPGGAHFQANGAGAAGGSGSNSTPGGVGGGPGPSNDGKSGRNL